MRESRIRLHLAHPTAIVRFVGSITCTLAKGSGNTVSCAVQYGPPPGQSIAGMELPIKALYSGDSNCNCIHLNKAGKQLLAQLEHRHTSLRVTITLRFKRAHA